jgi:hypothetical protein
LLGLEKVQSKSLKLFGVLYFQDRTAKKVEKMVPEAKTKKISTTSFYFRGYYFYYAERVDNTRRKKNFDYCEL